MTTSLSSADVDTTDDNPFVASEALSSAWERHRGRLFESAREVSEWLVDEIDPQPGDTVLEVGAGPGETGFLVAERVGPNGRLICTDLCPEMVKAARRGAEAAGLANVDCRVMDAQDVDLGDSSVDGVISRFAVMLVPNPRRVFAEALRVVRPGGRLAYAVWGAPRGNPWLTALGAALGHTGHLAVGDAFGQGGVCSLAKAERNRELLTATGFSDIRVEEILGVMRFESLDDYWDLQSQVAGALAVLAGSLPAVEVAHVRDCLESILAPFESHGSYLLPSLAVAVSAA